jgi:hypothetical protein
MRIRVIVVLLVILASTLGAPPVAAAAPLDRLAAYRGLATWTDIYDTKIYERPVASVRKMHAQGVRTLFLETANYRIDTPIFRPDVVATVIEAAHRRGMNVVAWYLPSFTNIDRDYRRSMAAIRFRTPNGHRFDGFAMDIESDVVRDLAVRNKRMNRLSKRVRAAVGPDYPLGAIVPEADAKYWHNFPYKTVARHYDVFLPMAYYTFRTSGSTGVTRWMRRNVRAIREATGDPRVPIHLIGGLSKDTTLAELRAFVDVAVGRKVMGASVYEFETTTKKQWSVLQRLR